MFDELHRIRGLIGEKVVAGGGGLSLQDDDDFAAPTVGWTESFMMNTSIMG